MPRRAVSGGLPNHPTSVRLRSQTRNQGPDGSSRAGSSRGSKVGNNRDGSRHRVDSKADSTGDSHSDTADADNRLPPPHQHSLVRTPNHSPVRWLAWVSRALGQLHKLDRRGSDLEHAWKVPFVLRVMKRGVQKGSSAILVLS